MIELKRGNILEADVEALVNTVNCMGVMGRGIALQFKQAFPENFRQYQRACRVGEVRPGKMFVVQTGLMNPRFIINFPTKRHWKGKSRLTDIEAGLRDLVTEVKRLGLRTVAVPPLGCGSGGLNWQDVRPVIESALSTLPDVHVLLFEPAGAPAPERMKVRTETPKMTRARALLLRLFESYRILGYRLSLLEIQKLAYFLQAGGEPLRLNFIKHRFGPYAEALNHVLERLEGHYIRGYGDRSRDAGIYLLRGASEEANATLAGDVGAAERLRRVTELIEGFETPYGMELLATVHWVAGENPEAARDSAIAIRGVRKWSGRKRQTFREQHIEKAWRRLLAKGWLAAQLESSPVGDRQPGLKEP
ncbi:MAG: macro domain-containing protein [Candidatus Rokubacteria bacterium]|nr:macro domain-containing protein [Candidatus Rokubacteria bacterium]